MLNGPKITFLTLLLVNALGLTQVSFAQPGKALFHKKNITTVSQVTGDKTHVSVEGKPLILFPLSHLKNSQTPKYRFYIQGGLHGNERLTSTFVVWLANRFSKGESQLNNFKESIAIDFLSVANPDGLRRNYRYNARAVNLNRNFPVLWGMTKENPGTVALSEPEAQSIKALFTKREYLAAIDVHGYINWIVVPSPPEMVKSNDPVQNIQYKNWLSGIKTSMRSLGKYELKTAGELGDGGAFEDWAFWDMGVFAACLEMSNGTRFAELHSNYFPKGTDTFLAYEQFIFDAFQTAIDIKRKISNHLSLSTKNPGNANAAGSTEAFK